MKTIILCMGFLIGYAVCIYTRQPYFCPSYFDLIVTDTTMSVPIRPGQCFYVEYLEPVQKIKIEIPANKQINTD